MLKVNIANWFFYRLFIHVHTKYFVCKHGTVKAPVSEKQDWSVKNYSDLAIITEWLTLIEKWQSKKVLTFGKYIQCKCSR